MQNTIFLHKQLKRFQLSFAFLVINPISSQGIRADILQQNALH